MKQFSDKKTVYYCPCDSGKKFESCCINKSFVTTPHYDIFFL
ncbi:SEC-C metal-binding domain-containing protein [Methanococcoides sp. NM1]